MVNTRFDCVRPIARVNALAETSAARGHSRDSGRGRAMGRGRGRATTTTMRYQSKILPKKMPLPYIIKR